MRPRNSMVFLMCASAFAGIGQAAGMAADSFRTFKLEPPAPLLDPSSIYSMRKGKTRIATNQRQRRKDKRRHHANGDKQAFLPKQ